MEKCRWAPSSEDRRDKQNTKIRPKKTHRKGLRKNLHLKIIPHAENRIIFNITLTMTVLKYANNVWIKFRKAIIIIIWLREINEILSKMTSKIFFICNLTTISCRLWQIQTKQIGRIHKVATITVQNPGQHHTNRGVRSQILRPFRPRQPEPKPAGLLTSSPSDVQLVHTL